ncbi:tripartite tricarboxylate transporter substrate binding protein [Variovorax guangxiensis]|uniref:Bug family tripartite tricarboxylate transporter substrate binding protein n=1 Tax=Variovorax guangxiensis TaxID=1775474 RepID=UPI002861AA3D|nr:tripartite tricarboxylate transporter substrate binding protein [Variovorax guangxiensis]MDR6858771.1 tripartite-type tricarboxylate transporter receptor subunit TctC [Variovorax guangxiensis]
MRIATLSIALIACLFAAGGAAAQDYPSKPIRWIVPYPAGGGADNLARLVTQRVSQALKQPIVVDNRPGGNTIIGTQALLASPKDGYTVMHTAEQLASNASLYPELKYSAEREIEFIAPMVRTPLVLLARPDLPASDAAGLFAFLKQGGDKVTFGSWGQGGANHLVMEAFADRVGVRPTHIPFPGAAPAIQSLLGGQIDVYFSDPTTALPYIRSGKLKALLVSTRDRLPFLPNVPTVHESGYPGFDMYTWQGLVAAKGIPPEVVKTLAATVRQTIQEPEIHKELLERGFIPDPGTPEQFKASFLRTQSLLGDIVRKLNIRIQ